MRRRLEPRAGAAGSSEGERSGRRKLVDEGGVGRFIGDGLVHKIPDTPRQPSKRTCCAARSASGGRVVSAFSVRCIRSCCPFWSGPPGWMRWWAMPSGRPNVRPVQSTMSRESPAMAVDTNGVPLSERIAVGNPRVSKSRRNCAHALACATDGSPRQHRMAREWASQTVSG